jgi:hypothetical protein
MAKQSLQMCIRLSVWIPSTSSPLSLSLSLSHGEVFLLFAFSLSIAWLCFVLSVFWGLYPLCALSRLGLRLGLGLGAGICIMCCQLCV